MYNYKCVHVIQDNCMNNENTVFIITHAERERERERERECVCVCV